MSVAKVAVANSCALLSANCFLAAASILAISSASVAKDPPVGSYDGPSPVVGPDDIPATSSGSLPPVLNDPPKKDCSSNNG